MSQSAIDFDYGRLARKSGRRRPSKRHTMAEASHADLPPQVAPASGGGFVPTEDQARAVEEIVAGYRRGERWLLTGPAGSGKSSALLEVISRFVRLGRRVVVTAPTHQAVKVMRKKMEAAGFEGVEARTIQSVLSLRPEPNADRLDFKRAKHAEPVLDDVVIIDECSMCGASLMWHVKAYLPLSFVLLCGDDAQLPPVGEDESEAFHPDTTSGRSELTKIVRQAEGNPILAAALTVRRNQRDETTDWSWAERAVTKPYGIYTPSPAAAEAWMRKAFTSDEFEQDADSFRYISWRNIVVDKVNRTIREWRYGREALEMPVLPGERVLFRNPVIRGEATLFATNEEVAAKAVERSTFEHPVPQGDGLPGWVVRFPSWAITADTVDGMETEVHMPQDFGHLKAALDRLRMEAAQDRRRWEHFHGLKQAIADVRPAYAITTHSAQGMTVRFAFLDLSDMRGCVRANPWEGRRLIYTALTRPTHAAILVNT